MRNAMSLAQLSRKFRANADVYLKKIKLALAEETDQTKAMLATYQRYLQGLATESELREANEQFKDLMKSIGLGFMVILPFSPLTIPAIVKLGKKYGVDVLPSAVRNQIESRGNGATE